MSRNRTHLAGALVALSLAAGPAATSLASAQETIMLETIGAVRMASPAEVRRINADPSRQPTPQIQPVPLSREHADLAR